MSDIYQPNNRSAEQAVIGSILVHGTQSMGASLTKGVRSDAFYYPNYACYYGVFTEMYRSGVDIDIVNTNEWVRKLGFVNEVGGASDISEMASSAPQTTAMFDQHVKIVIDNWKLRKLIRSGQKACELASKYAGDDASSAVAMVATEVSSINDEAASSKTLKADEAIVDAAVELDNLIEGRAVAKGMSTGLSAVDRIIGGLKPGRVYVIAARPGCGKSCLAVNICENYLNRGGKDGVVLFSLEMSKAEIFGRIVASLTGVISKHLQDGFATEAQKQQCRNVLKNIKQWPLWINDDGGATIWDIREAVRAVRSKHKVGLIAVDYLQLINPTDSRVQREQQISEASRAMKQLAKEMDCPVLLLSQLNREGQKENRKPRLSDLRESGSIEQDADVVMMIHNNNPDDNASGIREIIVAKNRGGALASAEIEFKGHITKLVDVVF